MTVYHAGRLISPHAQWMPTDEIRSLVLTDLEHAELLDTVRQAHINLLGEIRRTTVHEYKDLLRARDALLQTMLTKLNPAPLGTPQR